MITLTATSTPNSYDVLSSNLWDHYPLIVNQDNSIECGCPGYTYHGHCYHALEAKDLVTYQAQPTITAIPVEGTKGTHGHEVNCSCCGAWMMGWAWEKHLAGNFCEMYLSEKGAAGVAAPSAYPFDPALPAYNLPLAA